MQFSWHTTNPGEYPSYVDIGVPPVIGAAGDKAEWTTQVAVPQDVKGFYIMLSVESKRQRLFVNYAVDVADK